MLQRRILSTGIVAGILLLVQGCGGSGGGRSICEPGSGPAVTISGVATFDRVHHDAFGALDYSNITREPVRAATVEAVCNSVISTTTTDSAGNYLLSVPANTSNMFVRVKAKMARTGTPQWDFSVVDNTQAGALYSMASPLFNSGAENSTHNLHAASGWGGSSYTGTRVAAPFAILDSVYKALQKVLTEQPAAIFPALKLNWSIHNVPSSGSISRGQILTSYFDGTQIYLLGAEDLDIDEYDEHTIIHEWGHYFEEKFSRSDSIGGYHGEGEYLDMRVAFGEGFGYAIAGIILDDPVTLDAGGPGQSFGSGFDMDRNIICTNPGWYSECSMWSVLYDLYDASNDAADTVSLGLSPLYSVLVNEQRNTPAFTSIFSFIHELKNNLSVGEGTAIDTLLAGVGSNINTVSDIYGSGETNDAGSANVLPVYTDITAGDTVNSLCVSNDFAGFNQLTEEADTYNRNKLSSYRFLHLTVPTSKAYTITVDKSQVAIGPGRDPDIVLFQGGNGVIAYSQSYQLDVETLTVNLQAGQHYVLQINDEDVTYGEPPLDDTCYTVRVSL